MELDKAHKDWSIANAVVQGRMSLEEAISQVSTNKKRTRDFLKMVFTAVRTGRKMQKSRYDDPRMNAMDKMAGRQSQIEPSDSSEMFKRSYGMDHTTMQKSILEKACGSCGVLFKAQKEDDKICKNCEMNFKAVSWHSGDLG